MGKKFRRRKQKLPQELVSLTIDSMSHEGRGVARLEGKTVFVDGALSGETVEAKYTNCRSSFDEVTTVNVLAPSSQRVTPKCEHAAICGGCSLQHFEGKAQIGFKQSVLKELFSHAEVNADCQWLEPLTAEQWGYRTKARLGVKYVAKKQSVLVGFREKGSSFLADINQCEVLLPKVGTLITELRELIVNMDGRDRYPQIELASGDGQTAFILRHLDPVSENDMQLWLEFAAKHEIELYLQPKGPTTIHKVHPKNTPDRLVYNMPDFDIKLQFHPSDFTQVNQAINRKMVKLAIELLDPQPDERILDLFCGLGNFTIPLATMSNYVVGVEGSEAMVERGFENAKLNHLDNVKFYAADLTQDNSDEPWALEGFDKVLIDPPRSGAIEVLRHIPKYEPKVIVYVSCNPATLARDAAELQNMGYTMTHTGVMDMFPHTAHVESIARFEKS